MNGTNIYLMSKPCNKLMIKLNKTTSNFTKRTFCRSMWSKSSLQEPSNLKKWNQNLILPWDGFHSSPTGSWRKWSISWLMILIRFHR
jgi:hypothetical protein